jgi:hypothetical protein
VREKVPISYRLQKVCKNCKFCLLDYCDIECIDEFFCTKDNTKRPRISWCFKRFCWDDQHAVNPAGYCDYWESKDES